MEKCSLGVISLFFRPPSDGGLMILPETFCDVIVEAITSKKNKNKKFGKKRFKRSARFKRNFRHI